MARARQASRPTSTVEQAPDVCQECGGSVEMNRAAAEAVCTDCGLVHEDDAVDLGPEWSTHYDENGEARSRTGSPVTGARHDKGLTTTIGAGRINRDARGGLLSDSQRKRANRLKNEHSRTVRGSKTARNATYGLTEIKRIVTTLEKPLVIRKRASVLFQQSQEEDLLSGRCMDGFAAASVYAACREHDHPVVKKDLVDHARVDDSRITNAYVVMKRELDLEVLPFNPSDHVPRLTNELGLPVEATEVVGKITQAVEKSGLHSGRSPSGLAAGAVYYAFSDHPEVTQRSLGEVAGVSNMTVRNNTEFLEDCEPVPEM